MSFSFCLNKSELMVLAGFGLLFQGLNLDRKSKLIQDSQRLLCSVIEILERNQAPGAIDFKKVACAMISIDHSPKSGGAMNEPTSRRKSDGSMSAPKAFSKSARRFQAIASRFSTGSVAVIKRESGNVRRLTTPIIPIDKSPYSARSDSQGSSSSAVSETLAAQYPKCASSSQSLIERDTTKPPNLDYLSFNEDWTPSPRHISSDSQRTSKPYSYNALPSDGITQEAQNSMDALFPSADLFSTFLSPSPTSVDWSADLWNLASDVGNQPAAPSGISCSEEEITSGEELSTCDLSGDFPRMAIPAAGGPVGLDGLDNTFDL